MSLSLVGLIRGQVRFELLIRVFRGSSWLEQPAGSIGQLQFASFLRDLEMNGRSDQCAAGGFTSLEC